MDLGVGNLKLKELTYSIDGDTDMQRNGLPRITESEQGKAEAESVPSGFQAQAPYTVSRFLPKEAGRQALRIEYMPEFRMAAVCTLGSNYLHASVVCWCRNSPSYVTIHSS